MDTMTDLSLIRPSTPLRPRRWLSGVETSNVEPFIFVYLLTWPMLRHSLIIYPRFLVLAIEIARRHAGDRSRCQSWPSRDTQGRFQ